MKTIVALTVGIVAGAGVALTSVEVNHHHDAPKPVAAQVAPEALTFGAPPAYWQTHLCAEEDSVNCYWDAQREGNGVGHSFYTIQFGDQICTAYVDDEFAYSNNFCTKA